MSPRSRSGTPSKRRIGKASGRYTPPGRPRADASARYTPRDPRSSDGSPLWVPVFMGIALVVGIAVVMVAWFGLESGTAQLLLLLVGGASIIAGMIAATNYR